MALQEINFIRPEEVFTPSTEKARVRYKGYNGTERDIELADNLEGDVSEVINDTFVPNADGNVAFVDSDNVSHELLTAQGLGKAQVIATTWSELKALRDGGNLVAGSLYRITDYVTTTAQENTQSAGHQFDIVLLALSENKLAEEGWAMEHPTDVESLLGVAAASDEVTINNNKTAEVAFESIELTVENFTYNYFQNSNLSAWKVWYCLDNDTERFAWADDSVDEGSPASVTLTSDPDNILYRDPLKDKIIIFPTTVSIYGWTDNNDGTVYTTSTTPNVGDNVLNANGSAQAGISIASYTPPTQGTGLPNGRGVIYRLIDEFNNDLPYDFKNIQFPIPLTDGVYDSNSETSEYVYTFSSTFEDGACEDLSLSIVVNNIKVGNNMENLGFSLPINIFYQNGEESAFFQSLVFDNLSARNIVLGNAIYCSFGGAEDCVIATGVSKFNNIGYLDGEITSEQNEKVYVNGVEVAVVQGE